MGKVDQIATAMRVSSISATRTLTIGQESLTVTMHTPLEEGGVSLVDSRLVHLLLAMEADSALIRASFQAGMLTQKEHDDRIVQARQRFAQLLNNLGE